MMSNFRVRDLSAQVDEQRKRADRAEARVAELGELCELVAAKRNAWERSSDEGWARVAVLKAERTPKSMAQPRKEAWFLAHVPDECVMSLRWIPATYGDLGEGWVDQNNKPIDPVDWIPMPPRVEPDQRGEGKPDG